jgi:hypothetical protein
VHRYFRLIVVAFALVIPARHVAAQQSTPAQVRHGDSLLVADTIPKEDHAARNAFARALILPGWGHYSVGAYRRGAVFTVLEGTSWFMLTKTIVKLNQAKKQNGIFEATATDSLKRLIAADTTIARKLADPVAFEAALAANPHVSNGRSLISSRKNQRQDWITYTLFFTMASAVDAYVAANLRDFPVGVSANPRPDGTVALGLTVATGRRAR